MRSLAVLLVVLASACTHVVTVESTPPGATVLVEDRVVGTTPCTWREQTGRDDIVNVEVKKDGRAARFAYRKAGIATEAAAAAGAGSCAMCALGGAGVGTLMLALPLALVAGPLAIGVAAPFLIIGAYSAYLVGILLIAMAPQVFVLGVGEGARQGPDRIHVDLRGAVPSVQAQPGDMVVPLVGRRAAGASAAMPAPDPRGAFARCVGAGGG